MLTSRSYADTSPATHTHTQAWRSGPSSPRDKKLVRAFSLQVFWPFLNSQAKAPTQESSCSCGHEGNGVPTATSPVGRRQGPGAKSRPRIKAAHSSEKNGGEGGLLCSEEGWLLFLRTQGQLTALTSVCYSSCKRSDALF